MSEVRVAAGRGRGRVGYQSKHMEGWDGAREICRLGFLPSLSTLLRRRYAPNFPPRLSKKSLVWGTEARDALKNGLGG